MVPTPKMPGRGRPASPFSLFGSAAAAYTGHAVPVVEAVDVERAAARIAGRVRRTPVVRLGAGALGLPAGAVLKVESFQHTGSFKPRGAFNLLLAGHPSTGVVAASGGNAGIAVAYACRELELQATVFVPSSSPPVKVRQIAALGAAVVVGGAYYAEAYDAALLHAGATGDLLVHAYDAPEVLAGQGTVALELEQQAPEVDTVLVAVGGGGLIGGICSWYGDRVQVVAVESERAPSLHSALAAGTPVDVEVGGVAADSLGARRVGALGFAAVAAQGARSVLVRDDDIAKARQRLWDELRLVTEAGGATALAAVTSGAYQPAPGERVAVLLCGANTDPHDLVARA